MMTGYRTALLLAMAVPLPAWAAATAAPDDTTIIVTAPGGGMDADDALGFSADDIARAGHPDLVSALARGSAAITLQDPQGTGWQPNLVYRGFTASGLQGQAQGLAAYLDGVRFNQPFGDTVALDLLPDAAIRQVSLLDASPVYGLNALGGALVIDTRTGAKDPGLEASLTGGSDGLADASLAGGGARGQWSGYGAIQFRREQGWRAHSPSRLWNGYGDIGVDGATAGAHAKLVAADTQLSGLGVTPVELLAVNRRAVLTWPDRGDHRYLLASLHPWMQLSDHVRVEATLYAQRINSHSLNGDAADFAPCPDDGDVLCLDEDGTRLTDGTGNSLATTGADDYGLLNRSAAHSRAAGVLIQLSDRRPLGAGENLLVLGVSLDVSRTAFTASSELAELITNREVVGLGPIIDQADGLLAPVSLLARTRYGGLFVQDRLPLLPGLSAEIGLRYNHARIRLDDRIGTALNGLHRFNRLNPGVEFDYDGGEGLALRAGYAETNRAPTPAELSCADEAAPCSLANFFIADPPLRQVIARNWETGANGRTQLGAVRLDWSLAGWRSDSRDDIQHVASAIRGRAYFRNVGGTRRQGIEAMLKARAGRWTMALSYAFTDARFRSDFTISSPANPAADEDGLIMVAHGNRMPGIARHGLVVTVEHQGRGWQMGGDLIARSRQRLLGDENNAGQMLAGYVRVDLRGGLELGHGVQLFGEIRNLFDRDDASFGTYADVSEIHIAEVPGASDPRSLAPGAPRQWRAGLRFAY
jgi:outer membrane receptor protein involved in Fe transport